MFNPKNKWSSKKHGSSLQDFVLQVEAGGGGGYGYYYNTTSCPIIISETESSLNLVPFHTKSS